MAISKIDSSGTSTTVQSVQTTAAKGTSNTSTLMTVDSDRYTTNSAAAKASQVFTNPTARGTSATTSGLLDVSSKRFQGRTPSVADDTMTAVLDAGGLSAVNDLKKIDFISSIPPTIDMSSAETMPNDFSDVAASEGTTIYDDVISSNMLMSRGFDPSRAEILASFEFIPVVDSEETYDSASLYDVTPTTCLLLIDMQSQAQQMRLSLSLSLLRNITKAFAIEDTAAFFDSSEAMEDAPLTESESYFADEE